MAGGTSKWNTAVAPPTFGDITIYLAHERQRSTPTTEHCFMKNGKLECKSV